MAKITELPRTCSGYYVSDVSELDNLRGLIETRIAQDKDDPYGGRVCAVLSCVTRLPAKVALERVGFKKIGFYFSHRHHRKVFIMLRQTSAKEFKEKKAIFSLRKGEKK